MKNQFLKVVTYYKFLVREFTCQHPEDFDVDFAAQSYKFVGLIALIESLYTIEEYKYFYEWLIASSASETFPITNKNDLNRLYDKYCDEHGSTRKIVKFFQGMTEDSRQFIASNIIKLIPKDGYSELDEMQDPIEKLARLLFQIRSDFVHGARLVLEFQYSTVLSKRGKNSYCYNIDLIELEKIFEAELLRYFKLIPEKQVV